MNAELYPALVAIAALVVIAAVAMIGYAIYHGRQQARVSQRIRGHDDPDEDRFEGAPGGVLVQVAARQGREIEKFVDKSGGETRQLLAQAGWRHGNARLLFYALQGALPVILVVVVLIGYGAGLKLLHSPLHLILALIVAVILGLLLPRRVLSSAATKRRARLRAEVPLFVNLLVMLFEAGLSTRQALASLVREGGSVLPELDPDLDLIIRQLDAGGDSSELLEAYARSMDVDDLTAIIGILRQIDRYGGEVRGPLLDQLAVLEERRGLEMREKVNLISGRMTVVMVLFFFPALLIFTAGPAVIAIMHVFSHMAK
ncbi:MAG TPA: type II secretion system F family protein [Nevskiaceae bacterium]|nr:type II secretion system F family protein [Nevskiaceae bacterium]